MVTRVSQALGLYAVVALVGGVALLTLGARFDEETRAHRNAYVRRPSAHSDYMRSLHAQKVDDAGIVTMKTIEALALTGESPQAERLEGFYGQCNVARLLGDDAACRRVTIDAALHERVVATSAAVPIPGRLEAKLVNVLLPSPADVVEVRRSFQRPDDFPATAFADLGNGVWLATQSNTSQLYVAVKNSSEWTVTDFEMQLALLMADSQPRPDSSPQFYVYCRRTSPNLVAPGPLSPGATTVAYCRSYRGQKELAELRDAIRRAQQSGAPFLRPMSFTLRNPFVNVADRHGLAGPAFTVSALDRRDLLAAAPAPDQLQEDLRTLDCKTTGTCPSFIQGPALSLYGFFATHLWLLPAFAGVLMGMAIGGLSRPSFARSAKFAGIVFGIGIAAIALSLRGPSGPGTLAYFAMSGGAIYAFLGLLIWLPFYAAAIAAMNVAWPRD